MLKKSIKTALDVALSWVGKRVVNINSSPKEFYIGLETAVNFIGKPETVIDIGVAEGTPELYRALPLSNHKYFLIEPDSRYHNHLKKFEESHPGNVILLKTACGSKSGEVVFHRAKEGRHSSLHTQKEDSQQIKVSVDTLDQIFSRFQIKGPVLIKVDVEGAETEVLRGSSQALKQASIVIVESWMNHKNGKEQTFEELVAFMHENDFRVFDFLSGHCAKNGVLKLIDVVFVRNSLNRN